MRRLSLCVLGGLRSGAGAGRADRMVMKENLRGRWGPKVEYAIGGSAAPVPAQHAKARVAPVEQPLSLQFRDAPTRATSAPHQGSALTPMVEPDLGRAK